jgi:hypothetical protein
LESETKKFPDDIEDSWDEIIDSVSEKSWGINNKKRENGNKSWKSGDDSNCEQGFY